MKEVQTAPDAGAGAEGEDQRSGKGPAPAVKLRVLRVLAFVAVPAAFITFLAFGLWTSSGPGVRVGSPAPEFSLRVLSSDEEIGSGDLRGRPVVVNFWASWCHPCRQEAPDLEGAWKKYRGEGVMFLGIDLMDGEEQALQFVEEFGITYPIVRDVNGEVARDFGLRGVPETYFIDHTYRFSGFGAGANIGSRGSLVVRGAISPTLLHNQIEILLEKMSNDG